MPYINNNGVKIHYQVIGKGPPLVLLHGYFQSIEHWHLFHYVDKLKSDYQLILIDQRGRGKSDKPHEADAYSLKLFSQDVITVLDAIGINRAHVFGFSMGGWVTYGLADCFRDRVISIINSDGVPGSEDPELLYNMTMKLDEWVPNIPDATDKEKEIILNNDRAALLAIQKWVKNDIKDIICSIDSTIEQIDIPMLIFMSGLSEDSDEYRLLTKSVEMAPGAILVEFKELDHRNLHKRSDLMLPHIISFLRKND